MTRPYWLGRAVRKRHRYAIEQVFHTEFCEELVVGEARPAAARARDGRGRGAQRRTARWINTGRGYD